METFISAFKKVIYFMTVPKPKVTSFEWEGKTYYRVHWRDEHGRYSTETRLHRGDAIELQKWIEQK